jgi:hypothetical protein
MHLVAPLVSGIAGAENGHAEIYKRGTAARATYYTGFTGTGSVASGANVTLDANGGAVVYVDELVDVKVYSSLGGSSIREFVAGVGSGALEVISTSFTGTDDDASVGASKRTTGKSVWDLWFTQNAALDWKVKVGATTKTLPNWIGETTGMLFNVKGPAYGAVGDGVADDTSAINAAITAAGAAGPGGGIVFLPPGTYLINAALTLDAGVSLMGSGPHATIIKMNHASNVTVQVQNDANNARFRYISGIKFQAAQACSGDVISVGEAFLAIEKCTFGGDGYVQGDLIRTAGGASTGYVIVRDCFLLNGAAGSRPIQINLSKLTVENCYIYANSGTQSVALLSGESMTVRDCYFDNSLASSGTYDCVYVDSGGTSRITECEFTASGGATVTGIHTQSLGSGEKLYESDNHFVTTGSNAIVPYDYSAGTNDEKVVLETRALSQAVLNDNGATVSVDSQHYGTVCLQVDSDASNSGTPTVNLHADIPLGQRFYLVLWNDGVAAGLTFTIGSTTAKVSGTIAVAQDKKKVVEFVAVEGTGGTPIWYQVNTPVEVDE